MTTLAREGRPILFGPVLDLLLGCGLGYALVVVLLAAAGVAMDAVSGFLPFVVLFTGIPHYGATLLRVFGDAEARRRWSGFTFAIGVVVVAILVASLRLPRLGAAFITLYLSWSPFHYTRQNFGLVMMFLRKAGVAPSPGLRRLVHGSFLLSFLLVLVNIHGAAGAGGSDPLYSAEGAYRFSPLGIPAGPTNAALAVLALAWLGVTLASCLRLVRVASAEKLAPAFCLFASQAAWFVAPVLLGRVFPGLYGEKGPTALAFIWVAIAHSIQYLWIAIHYARASGSVRPTLGAAAHHLGAAILAGAALWFVPAYLFAPGRLGALPFESGLGLLVAAAVNLHHFILDGVIWKLRDKSVGAALLAEEKPEAAPPSPSSWARAALVAVGLFGVLGWVCAAWEKEMGERRASAAGDLSRLEIAAQRLALVGRDGPRVHASLGRLLARRGDEEAALAAYRQSLSLAETPAAWVGIGKIFQGRRDFEAAQKAYESALGLDPKNAMAMDHLADVFYSSGDLKRALETRYRATLAAPERPELRKRYEDLLAKMTAPEDSAAGEEILVGGDGKD